MSNTGKKAAALARRNAALATRNDDGTVTFQVSAAGLQRPTNIVVANWASVERLGHEFEFIFGQLIRREKRLTAALYVTMPCARMAELLNDGSFLEALEAYVRGQGLHGYQPEADVAMPQDRNVFERASLGFLAQAEDEAEARFFHISPSDGTTRPFEELKSLVKPVVTVMMSTSVLWHVCRASRELLR